MVNIISFILHEWSEQSECSEVKGIKKGIKNSTCLYMEGRGVSLPVCVSVYERKLNNF